uniref:Nucleotide-diphospho-sugar transferase domain-containing protein n=1 Tax=viral metagenome TaxID=1070528 RepID=A0A6C0E3H9_9ZZZZ
MFVAFSFIGVLPSYIKETVHQVRCFFEGDIYLIVSQIDSIYLDYIKKYNVHIVNYQDVKSLEFCEVNNQYGHKMCCVDNLQDRKYLFMRSLERFFLVENLMKQKNLKDCLFLELDNLIYEDPNKWIDGFSKNELCYMFDNYDRYSSGIMYIKNPESLSGLLTECLNHIKYDNGFISEMTALYKYYAKNKETVQILPTYWIDESKPLEIYLNYSNYNDTIFDSAPMGCYLFGMDTIHTGGVIIKHQKSRWAYIDATQNKFIWQTDEKDRKRPYIWNGEKWILINNLHLHAKNLEEGISLPL